MGPRESVLQLSWGEEGQRNERLSAKGGNVICGLPRRKLRAAGRRGVTTAQRVPFVSEYTKPPRLGGLFWPFWALTAGPEKTYNNGTLKR